MKNHDSIQPQLEVIAPTLSGSCAAKIGHIINTTKFFRENLTKISPKI